MKNVDSFKRVVLISFISVLPVFAHAGGGSPGGGDLQCDAQIRKIVGVDAKKAEGSLYYWYSHGGPQKDSQLDLSYTRDPGGKPYGKHELAKAMLNLMNKPLRSGCVHHQKGDQQRHPIMIGGVPKVCRTTVTDQFVDMLCDSDIFLTMKTDQLSTADLQIQQINHEYAINIQGLEPDYASVPDHAPYNFDISTYTFSQQLTAVTQTVEERKVMVMDPRIGTTANTKQSKKVYCQISRYKTDTETMSPSQSFTLNISGIQNEGDSVSKDLGQIGKITVELDVYLMDKTARKFNVQLNEKQAGGALALLTVAALRDMTISSAGEQDSTVLAYRAPGDANLLSAACGLMTDEEIKSLQQN